MIVHLVWGQVHLLLVGLGADIFKDMGDTQLELICYGSYPWVALCLKHLLWASQVQITYRERNKKRVRECSRRGGNEMEGV